jgi:hypothetical protein
VDPLHDRTPAAALSTAEEYFDDLDIPPGLEASLRRHREHLAALIRSLRSAGIGEEQIDASVSAMLTSYKQELLRAIKVIRG